MESETTFILLGNSGAGKSASGNTILGRTAFESKQSFSSVTTEISEQAGAVLGKQISVIDTPGILGPDGEEEDSCAEEDFFMGEDSRVEVKIKNHCDELLREGRSCVFLIVVKIARFTREQKDAVEAALRVIGKEQVKNSYLLFTGEDKLDNKTLEEFMNENPKGSLRKLVSMFGERYHVFNNKSGGQKQVKELLKKSGLLRSVSAQSARLEERRIVLLGLPGVGKSSSGNTILGLQSQSDCFKSGCDFTSVTKETDSKSAEVEGRRVTVVDTPGITGEGWAPKKLFEEIMKSIKASDPGPHAFIFVVKLDRISKADEKLFELLPKLFDRDAPKYSMVLFTHVDKLEGGNILAKIRDSSAVLTLLRKCRNRYCEFNNRQPRNKQQVRHLLDKINQMVTANGGGHYTSDLFNNVHTLPVSLSIKWHDVRDSFEKILNDIVKWLNSSSSTNANSNQSMALTSYNPLKP
ncbi:GTPase IMAP family member 8-like [Sphaeramia orbicularis]|uniref:GTPase IMAP family member 8 n=1 Tax=Sphaeramia orbicularis TaxID=375764 RepID=A0A673BUI6_9TELE|nr:GTPase IMAP family member 8-like [Sphaeramia orbicularis]XP_030010117.1 GTPase IMAP family member 8-like [Sphaeramia orbicularis]XP_030010118.1 GTPase IMAP family member 8-like [Sphaeramia orbicularis]